MTDRDKSVGKIKSFVDGNLMDLSCKLKRDGRSLFRLKPDGAACSYYEDRVVRKIRPEDFKLELGDAGATVGSLAKLWRAGACPEMEKLVPDLQALIEDVAKVKGDRSSEISPYIYEMF